jgi:energy-coupling factor transporter ATP-binding protein EcfA2
MAHHAYKLPSALSGGEQQRVAIARALANDPPIVVADEPTGNLDSQTAEAVMQLFEKLVTQDKTILMVTHDTDLTRRASRIITLADGEIVAETTADRRPQSPQGTLVSAHGLQASPPGTAIVLQHPASVPTSSFSSQDGDDFVEKPAELSQTGEEGDNV